VRALLLLFLAGSAFGAGATKPWLSDGTSASQNVNVIGGNITVDNAVIVTTVTAQVPVQRSQSLLGRFFTTNTGAKTSSTAESPALLFINLSTNTRTVYLDAAGLSSLDNNVTSVFRLYTSPVVTSSGTALVPRSMYSVAGVSEMQAYLNPTLSSNGTLVRTLATTSGQVAADFLQARIIIPGEKILFTIEHSANNKRSNIDLRWDEE
jgi:hypothetical protein